MTTRAQVVAEARTWLGTRFQHQGRLKGVACDCVGLLVGVTHALGLSDFDQAGYTRQPDGVMLKRACDDNMTAIDVAAVQPGDVLLFRFEADPQHVAIVGDYVHGGLSIIHAYSLARKGRELGWVVETGLDDKWRARIVAAYQLPGVA